MRLTICRLLHPSVQTRLLSWTFRPHLWPSQHWQTRRRLLGSHQMLYSALSVQPAAPDQQMPLQPELPEHPSPRQQGFPLRQRASERQHERRISWMPGGNFHFEQPFQQPRLYCRSESSACFLPLTVTLLPISACLRMKTCRQSDNTLRQAVQIPRLYTGLSPGYICHPHQRPRTHRSSK